MKDLDATEREAVGLGSGGGVFLFVFRKTLQICYKAQRKMKTKRPGEERKALDSRQPDPPYGRSFFWMTELSNNSLLFASPGSGASHSFPLPFWRRRRTSGKGGAAAGREGNGTPQKTAARHSPPALP